MNKISNDRTKLFDGLEDSIEKEKIQLKNTNLSINDIIKNPVEDLKSFIGDNDFQKIIKDLKINEDNNMFISYKSQNGLDIYYVIKNSELVIFSYGEFQPARYQLYLEGIYSLK